MKVKDLIARLQKLDSELEVAILDGFNGDGQPRTINFGPIVDNGIAVYDGDARADYGDLDTLPGNDIVIMGYGCY